MNDLLELFSFPAFMLAVLFVGALFLMLALGNPLIAWLKGLKGMKWSPREDTPDSHLQKAGVPSMGGLGIIGAALIGYAAVMLFVVITEGALFKNNVGYEGRMALPFVLFPAIVGLHMVLGFIDDWSKARGRGGISSKAKLLGQLVLGISFLAFLAWDISLATYLGSPFKALVWCFLALLVIVGTSNAVNLTDGIDGLAAGLSVQCAGAFAIVVLWPNAHSTNALYFMPQIHASLIGIVYSFAVLFVWLCLGGACLGFLAFNRHPAKVFMGDTGSLALGAALGAGALLTGTVWLLPFVGFMFFVEMFSVIFQVSYFKYTKKKTGEGQRIFRRAPLHHHFELGGWSEWRVVGTFWAVNFCTTVLGLALWKMGVLPRFP